MRILNLGSGKDYRADCVNLDIRDDVGADIVADIAGTLPYMEPFDRILANDVLEHIPRLVSAMTNCLDLLVLGGEMHVLVPYDLSYGAWQDPTHVRAFNERSWIYYCDWHWYLGWKTHRFEVTQCTMNLSQVGADLESEHRGIERICRTPRAVDSMSVVLRKRAV